MKKLSKRFKAGLSLFLVCGMILGNVISANAAVDNRVDECILKEERVDSSAKEFNNDEVSGNKDSAAMLDSASSAAIAAENAQAAVDELTKNIAELGLDTKTDNAVAASNGAVTAAQGAESAANVASGTAAAASASAVSALDAKEEYDEQLALDQEAIDGINLTTAAAIETVVSEAAIEAKDRADRAKELLDIALTGDAKDAIVKVDGENKTVEQVVAMIGEAADAANTAYVTASTAAVNAENDLTAAIKEYNRYAVTYGEPLYGEDEVTYLDDDSCVVYDGLGFTDDEIEAIEAQRELAKSFDNDRADALSKEIADCTASVEAAKETVQTAKNAAEGAKELYDAAKDGIAEKIGDVKDKAHDAIELVADRTAGEAKEARETYEKRSDAKDAPISSTNLEETKEELQAAKDKIAEETLKKEKAQAVINKGNGKDAGLSFMSGEIWNAIKNLFGAGDSAIKVATDLSKKEANWFISQDTIDEAAKFVKDYNDAVENKAAAEAQISLYTAKKEALEKKEIAETRQQRQQQE